jgi:hypothetical protein
MLLLLWQASAAENADASDTCSRPKPLAMPAAAFGCTVHSSSAGMPPALLHAACCCPERQTARTIQNPAAFIEFFALAYLQATQRSLCSTTCTYSCCCQISYTVYTNSSLVPI